MACVCSHEDFAHRDGRECTVDDGHPEYGGPDPCRCVMYEDGEDWTDQDESEREG